jgi:hypothetical protein
VSCLVRRVPHGVAAHELSALVCCSVSESMRRGPFPKDLLWIDVHCPPRSGVVGSSLHWVPNSSRLAVGGVGRVKVVGL